MAMRHQQATNKKNKQAHLDKDNEGSEKRKIGSAKTITLLRLNDVKHRIKADLTDNSVKLRMFAQHCSNP